MEKKFLSSLSSTKYLPARLVKGKFHWYIVWYQTDPSDGIKKRCQKTFSLGRIISIKDRIKHAQRIIHEINCKLPEGWPYTQGGFKLDDSRQLKDYSTITDAVDFAHSIKSGDTDRIRTKQMYDSVRNIFLNFLKDYQYENIDIKSFTKGMAMEFFDHLVITRGIGNRTYNNYLIRVKALFNALEEREFIETNPFNNINKKREFKKKRKKFDPDQRRVVASYIRENDTWLYRFILLEYYCYIRPYEQRFLKFKYFNFNKGTILVPGEISKNHKDRLVTIPDIIIREFLNPEFCKYPANLYIFGAGVKPGLKPIGINTMRTRHNKIIEKLKKAGKIDDTSGLTLYSWKDTGITEALENKNVLSIHIKNQADHWSMDQTLEYYHEPEVNESFKRMKVRIDQ